MLASNATIRHSGVQRPVMLRAFLVGLTLASGCAQEMMNQRRVESQEETTAFADGRASQAAVTHTIAARGGALDSVSLGQSATLSIASEAAINGDPQGYLSGKVDGQLRDSVPDEVLTRLDYAALLQRGQQRFNISCAPCHDRTGSGNGMVPRRGLKFPPSYHTDRLRGKPLGYLFNVATHGRGEMSGYGDYISTDDRWAIVAYVRTLQMSQYFPVDELSADDRKQLEAAQQGKAVESP